MLVLTAEPGSADADRLHLLASLRATRSNGKATSPTTSRWTRGDLTPHRRVHSVTVRPLSGSVRLCPGREA
ncbi:hypothetical protein ACWEQO_32675 [Streptomyces sp. NPDC004051]